MGAGCKKDLMTYATAWNLSSIKVNKRVMIYIINFKYSREGKPSPSSRDVQCPDDHYK